MPTYMKVTNRGDVDNNNDEDWPLSGEAFGSGTGGGRTGGGHDWWILIDSFDFSWQTDDGGEDLSSEEAKERRLRREMSRRRRSTGDDSGPQGLSAEDLLKAMERADDRDSNKKTLEISKVGNTSSPQFVDWMTEGEIYDARIEVCAENDEMIMRVDVVGCMVDEFRTTLSSSGSAQDDTAVKDTIKLTYEAIVVTTVVEDERGNPSLSPATMSQAEEVGASLEFGPSAWGLGPTGAGTASEAEPNVVRTGANIGGPYYSGATATLAAAGRAAVAVEGSKTKLELQTLSDRRLTIDDVDGIEFQLRAFEGVEEMSRPFEFLLEVFSSDVEVDGAALIGQPVAWRMEGSAENADAGDPPREFHGIIREFYSRSTSDDLREYAMFVVPSLWFLQQRTDCRIFQNMDPLAIIEDVFGRIGFTDYNTANVRATYPELEYCVQYRESDFNFVHRLMEEFGIFYFWKFEQGSHEMVLADGSAAHGDCARNEVVMSSGAAESEMKVSDWSRRIVHIPGKTFYRDYNHTNPQDKLEAEENSKIDLQDASKYEIFDYPGRYPDVSFGRMLAGIRIEQEEAEHDEVSGVGNYPEFTTGTKFTVEAHDVEAEVGQEYLLTRVEHSARMQPGTQKERLGYVNLFECIPAAVTFRAPLITPRPIVHGPQTAVVVGTQSEEIDTDKYASVKLAFFWDRETPADENSSCWVRVAQSHAHKNWGGVAIPRIGQEVVVEYLEGNPDRPLVVGAVYNEDNLPPWELPANKTQTGWKSRSTKNGTAEHFNELRFEDKKDNELIYFHAEKDFERVVQHDDTLTVGEDGEGQQTITIETDQTETIKKNQTLTVGESGDGSQTITVEKDRSVTVSQGDETYEVKMGNRTSNIKMGDDTVNVKMGNHSLTLDMGNQTTHAKLGKITLKAMQSIELKVGSNSIKVDMMGVEIKGMMVKAKGEIMTEVKGMMTTVKGDAMLQAGGGLTMIG